MSVRAVDCYSHRLRLRFLGDLVESIDDGSCVLENKDMLRLGNMDQCLLEPSTTVIVHGVPSYLVLIVTQTLVA